MENDTLWELKQEDDGFIEENGHKGLKEDMGLDNLMLRQLNTKERGRTACKMVMDLKHMPMKVGN